MTTRCVGDMIGLVWFEVSLDHGSTQRFVFASVALIDPFTLDYCWSVV